MKAVLPCLRQSFGLTKWETAPWTKNWQKRRAAGSGDVSQPLDLDGTISVPANLVASYNERRKVTQYICTSVLCC
jgi:hypothetical protein